MHRAIADSGKWRHGNHAKGVPGSADDRRLDILGGPLAHVALKWLLLWIVVRWVDLRSVRHCVPVGKSGRVVSLFPWKRRRGGRGDDVTRGNGSVSLSKEVVHVPIGRNERTQGWQLWRHGTFLAFAFLFSRASIARLNGVLAQGEWAVKLEGERG